MQKVKLGDAFYLQMGKTPARNNKDYWGGNIKWAAISDLGKDKYLHTTEECITEKAVIESGIKPVPSDTIIMSFKLSIGKVAITSEEVYTNEAIMAFIDKGIYDFDIDYLYYLFSGYNWTIGTNKAVKGLTLNKATLSEKVIAFPTLTVQKAIAEKLDKVSILIEKRKQQLSLLDALVKSKFVEMFGDLRVNPRHWSFMPLSMVCDVRDGTHDSPEYCSEGYPLMTSKNFSNGEVDFTDVNLISQKDFDLINKRSKVDIGDVIMPMIGTIGHPVIVNTDKPFAIKNVALIKFDLSKVSNIFIKAILDSDYFATIIEEKNRGNTQKFIALGDIRNVGIPNVPIDMQNKFADFVKQTEKTKAKIKQSLAALEFLKKSLMQKYFG